METGKDILEKIRVKGFKDINEFVKANLCYLPEDKRILFYNIEKLERTINREKSTVDVI